MIQVSLHEPGEFISPIFLRPKSDRSYRMILNLKKFNEFVEYNHLKIDTLDAVIKMMKPSCFMASVDLQDAYYTVPVHLKHRMYLKFLFNGTLYQYTSLPNGLSSAPPLHEQGYLNSVYIDDSLIFTGGYFL